MTHLEKPVAKEIASELDVLEKQTAQDLSDLALEVDPSHKTSPDIPFIKSINDLSDDLSIAMEEDREAVQKALVTEAKQLGIDTSVEITSPEIIQVLKARVMKSFERTRKGIKAENYDSITSRFTQLRKEETPLQSLLVTLREEFKGKIDEETNIVLSRYEALFSEELLPDKEERKAVETLFYSQDVKTFTAASFTGFVHTLYEQPDDVISVETKARIEKKFQIPRQRITTGGQLAKAAFAKDEEGNYQHGSPENALHLDNGMSSYVQPNGEAVVSLHTPQSKPRIIYVRSLETWFSEDAAKNITYGIIRDAVFDNLDQMTGLFGGDQEEHDWMKIEHKKPVERANRFIRLLTGNREPNYILQYEDMPNIRSALKAMVDPRNQSEEDNYNDLRELGVLNGDQLNWNRLKIIGLILRRNRYFKTQAVKSSLAPHLHLKNEVQKLDRKNPAKEISSAFAESGGD